jgi:hypothetical protein
LLSVLKIVLLAASWKRAVEPARASAKYQKVLAWIEIDVRRREY